MLSAIHRAFDLVKQGGGPCLTLATVPAEDPRVYKDDFRGRYSRGISD